MGAVTRPVELIHTQGEVGSAAKVVSEHHRPQEGFAAAALSFRHGKGGGHNAATGVTAGVLVGVVRLIRVADPARRGGANLGHPVERHDPNVHDGEDRARLVAQFVDCDLEWGEVPPPVAVHHDDAVKAVKKHALEKVRHDRR